MNNNSCIMSSGELRRSSRITELEARRAEQENSKKERKLAGAQEMGTKKVPKKKRGSKNRKNGPVPDLDGTSTGQDHYTFDADVAFRIALPSKEKLMQVLDRLQQKDKNGYFAEPADANEVEHYSDVLTEPMDFSSIAEKIDAGSYETFTDFADAWNYHLIRFILDIQYDIYLGHSNAMLFNAQDTVYYNQLTTSIVKLLNRSGNKSVDLVVKLTTSMAN
ncbi:hypothetical protein Q3G72_008981 [Acer saccharum]|nr:hypothetical protein Q3G72_008981 [Acer saccharum]